MQWAGALIETWQALLATSTNDEETCNPRFVPGRPADVRDPLRSFSQFTMWIRENKVDTAVEPFKHYARGLHSMFVQGLMSDGGLQLTSNNLRWSYLLVCPIEHERLKDGIHRYCGDSPKCMHSLYSPGWPFDFLSAFLHFHEVHAHDPDELDKKVCPSTRSEDLSFLTWPSLAQPLKLEDFNGIIAAKRTTDQPATYWNRWNEDWHGQPKLYQRFSPDTVDRNQAWNLVYCT